MISGPDHKPNISDEEITRLLNEGWFLRQIRRKYRVGKNRVQRVDRARTPEQRGVVA